MGTLLVLILGLAFFALLIWLLSFYWQRVVDKNIMVHFRAAEAITDHNRLPDEWITEVTRNVGRTAFRGFKFRRLSGIDLVLEKLDTTIQFFEEGSFYADDDAKQILLTELADARLRIGQMSWEAILLEHDDIRNAPPEVSASSQ